MSYSKEELQKKIQEIELTMNGPHFWEDKDKAQQMIKEYQDLKDALSGVGKYDKGGAVLSIISGAGGDDAEDFSAMLLHMYDAYIEKRGWFRTIIHEHKTTLGGYRNISIEVIGSGVYGALKHESGVHRLVRISPFNANAKRHTSFSLVEVVPLLPPSSKDISIPESELSIEFSKSSGPGGQNVNKRETAVRIVHLPTNISATCDSERSQERNREKAFALLSARVLKKREDDEKKMRDGLSVSQDSSIEWGNQIRSYVLHPYKMVKDHRTLIETSNVDSVLENGEIEDFIKGAELL